MKLYYVVNARLPSKKAYGIQIAKMCEAFIEEGVDLTLVIPRTRAARTSSMEEFYGLRVAVPTVLLPTVDWYHHGRIGYVISSLFFSLNLMLFFLQQRNERGIYYSIPDPFSFTIARWCGIPAAVEIHEPWQTRGGVAQYARNVIATNSEIARALEEQGIPKERILIEPNGVDIDAYAHMPSKEEARAKLRIALDTKIALYVGRLYRWKGLEILADAAQRAPDIDWYVVGGSEEEFRQATSVASIPHNLQVAGEVAPSDVPVWLAAADVLLVLGTKTNETSYRYTAPMKVFEYMAARRPVVASATPALKSIVSDELVRFYEPDNIESLVIAAREAIAGHNMTISFIEQTTTHVACEHSWENRATRILNHITPQL